jgi:hypothetical protein
MEQSLRGRGRVCPRIRGRRCVKWRTKKAVSCGIFAKKGTLSLSFDHISMIWRQWRQDKTGDWWKGSQVSPGRIFLNPREVCTTRLGFRLAFICAHKLAPLLRQAARFSFHSSQFPRSLFRASLSQAIHHPNSTEVLDIDFAKLLSCTVPRSLIAHACLSWRSQSCP